MHRNLYQVIDFLSIDFTHFSSKEKDRKINLLFLKNKRPTYNLLISLCFQRLFNLKDHLLFMIFSSLSLEPILKILKKTFKSISYKL